MKTIRYMEFKKGKMIEPIFKPMTTDGWLDKFRQDTFDNEKQEYETILYLFNLEDGEEAMRLWFLFQYGLTRIIEFLKKELGIRKEEEFASIFLSNKPEDIYGLGRVQEE